MAKNIGVVQFTGKMGEVVGQKSAYGSNVLRKRVFNIKNPESAGQATQRMKTTPAQNFYRALAEILDHAFQGVKYGAPSYSYFLKKAMSMTSGFPYLVKGDKTPWPGQYLVAEGGLPTPMYMMSTNDIFACPFTNSPDDYIEQKTVADFTADFISQFGAQEGDQVTIVLCRTTDALGTSNASPIYAIGRIILNSADNTPLDQVESLNGINMSSFDGEAGFSFPQLANTSDGDNIAMAVIVSRPPRTAGGSWQRSSSYFAVSDKYKEFLLTNYPFDVAKASYMKKNAVPTSPYYLNGGELNEAEYNITVAAQPTAGGTVTGGGDYADHERATLVATPNTGYDFVGWYDAVSNDLLSNAPTYLLEVSRPWNIVAKFEQQ